MRILQVNSSDRGGGAEAIARILHEAYRGLGHEAWLAVGKRLLEAPGIVEIPNDARRNLWARAFLRLAQRPLGDAKAYTPSVILGRGLEIGLGQPQRLVNRLLGHEDFDFPATSSIASLSPQPPDILHLHNLHGRYFDLRQLPRLTAAHPTVVTLHDMWLMTGHCAYSIQCQRWRSGCGNCPDLRLPPDIWRDGTSFNHRRKAAIYQGSRLYLATPSQWLMKHVQDSILAPSIVEQKVIPYGIDVSIFAPADREACRAELEIPPGAAVLLFAAQLALTNPFKDFPTLRKMMERIGARTLGRPIIMIALGSGGVSERIGSAEMRYVPFEPDPRKTARYFQLADVYVHAANADNSPLVVLEALACGTPVVATAVGGIPEQVNHGVTGYLTPAGDDAALAHAVVSLLEDEPRRREMGRAATIFANHHHALRSMTQTYLDWYAEIIEARNGEHIQDAR